MADFEGIPLLGAAGSGGALLFLRDTAQADIREIVAPGVEVHAIAGARALVVRGLTADSYETAMFAAPEYANRALDLVALKGQSAAVLSELKTTHAAWWEAADGLTVRLRSTASIKIGMGGSVEVRDENGSLVVTKSGAVAWHDSMRYFRMSQTTEDLYDAFRNVYLALESLLSHIAPVKLSQSGKPADSEAGWLRGALSIAASMVDLSRYVVIPSSDLVDDVFKDLYTKVRTSIFHAKNGRMVLLPQDQAGRLTVLAAKERYTRLYLDLAHHSLNVLFPSGAMTSAGFSLLASPLLETLQLHVTDDLAPVTDSDTLVSPSGGLSVPLTTRRASALDQPMQLAILGNADVSAIQSVLPHIARFGATDQSGELAHADVLGGRLNLSGFTKLECMLIIEGVNMELPKARYAT